MRACVRACVLTVGLLCDLFDVTFVILDVFFPDVTFVVLVVFCCDMTFWM